MLGQRVRRGAALKQRIIINIITPARNIMYFFSVLNIYELEPAAPNTQK